MQTVLGMVVISTCLVGVLSVAVAAAASAVPPEDVQVLGTFPGIYFYYCELF